MLPADGPISEIQHRQVRDAFRLYQESKGITLADVGRQIGRSGSTLSQWLSGTYAGDNDAVSRLIAVFMDQHARGEKPGMPRGFVNTTIVKRMIGVLRKVQSTQTMGVIYGPAGVSKSVVCRAAESGLIVGSTHIECELSTRTPTQMAALWAETLGLKVRYSLGHLERAIINHLKGTKRLQMIDEAQYLSKDSLNVVRDVHKKTGCGIVLVGTIDVNQRVDDASAFYGQFSRLIAYRYDIVEEQESGGDPMFTVQNVVEMAAAMQLRLTGDGAEHLTELACMPGWGGLGAAATLLLRAKILAKGLAISAKHMIDADTSYQGRKHAALLNARHGAFTRKFKVA